MPKVSFRSRRGRRDGPLPVTVAFVATPKKVSFEENHEEPECDHASLTETKIMGPITDSMENLPRRPTLVRPKSSLSLVDMGKSVDSMDGLANIGARRCAPVSPLSSPRPSREPSLSRASQLPSSPWGQFVDMATLDLDCCRLPPANYTVHESYSRRHRASPYGEYKPSRIVSKTTPVPLGFEVSDWSLPDRTFRLTPRHSNKGLADDLAGALHRLQVD